jgi:hypothetical protein
VALKGEAGIGLGEWGKQCGGCWVLWPSCVFECISVVVVGVACAKDCRVWGTVGWSARGECVGGKGNMVTGWWKMGRVGEGQGREQMRRGRKSSWEGEQ